MSFLKYFSIVAKNASLQYIIHVIYIVGIVLDAKQSSLLLFSVFLVKEILENPISVYIRR